MDDSMDKKNDVNIGNNNIDLVDKSDKIYEINLNDSDNNRGQYQNLEIEDQIN
jgi:hypothetical protein